MSRGGHQRLAHHGDGQRVDALVAAAVGRRYAQLHQTARAQRVEHGLVDDLRLVGNGRSVLNRRGQLTRRLEQLDVRFGQLEHTRPLPCG